MTNANQIRVLISFDQRLVADGLSAILSRYKDFYLCGQLKHKTVPLEELSEYGADVLIIELCDMSVKNIEFVRQVHQSNPELKLLIVSCPVSHTFLEELMHFCNGYLLRTCSSEKVIRAITEICESGKYLCPQLIDTLLKDDHKDMVEIELTARENEILALWFTLNSNLEIADQLNISSATVRSHIKNIRQKFGNASQLQMMIYACQENILPGKFKPMCPNCRSFCSVVS